MEQVVEQVMDLIAPVLNKAVELACAFMTAAAKKLWQLCGAAAKKAADAIGGKVPEEARNVLRIVKCAAGVVTILSGALFFLSRGKKR